MVHNHQFFAMEDNALATIDNARVLVDSIRLPEDAIKGLVPIQIQQMKETAVNVNQAMGVAGRAQKQAASDLFELKANLRHGNWTAFIKSGVLAISEKAASDLVNSHEKWLRNSDVDESLLGAMTPRTMSAIANADAEAKKEVLAKLISGMKPTEAQVRAIINEKKAKKTAATKIAVKTEMVNKKSSIEELVALTEKCDALEKENATLKAKVKELEAQLLKS